ncbi:hypothetical protein EGW08_019060, partial [Elysia chlorotica]
PSAFVITYVGTSLPEAGSVQITIDYGDGTTADSGPHAFPVGSTGASTTIQHVYASDNTFTATVTVFSDCCSVLNNVSVGVYKGITNLQASIYYLADVPPGAQTYGLLGNSQVYPTNKALHFVMTNQDNVFATAYEVTVNAGGSVILTCVKTSPTFTLLL